MNPRSIRLRSVELRRSTSAPERFKKFVIAISAAWVAVGTFLLIVEGGPPIKPLLLLAALIVAAENRDRVFGDETSISGSIIVGIAAAFMFHGSAPLVGPLFVASCAAVYWPHIRDREIAKIVVNGSCIGLSGVAGALVLQAAPPVRQMPLSHVLFWAVPVSTAYWLLNSILLSFAATSLRGGSFRRMSLVLLWSEKSVFGFAILGGLCGALYVREGTAVGIGALILLLASFDITVLARSSLATRAPLQRVTFRSLPIAAVAITSWKLVPWIGVPAAVLTAIIAAGVFLDFFALLRFRRALGTWEFSLAFGMVLTDLPLAIIAVVAGALAAEFGVLVALGFAVIALTAQYVASDLLRRRRDVISPSDEELLGAIEFALLDRSDRAPTPI